MDKIGDSQRSEGRSTRLLRKAWTTLRDEGPIGLARASRNFVGRRHHSWRDARLDRRFGIDTCGVDTNLTDLRASDEHAAHGNYYEPIQIDVFMEMMRELPVLPQDYCFIDFGSGKGRALILAAEAGFGEVIGVEYCEPLHVAAARNIDAYRRSRPKSPPIEAFLQDATNFDLPATDSVFFFYNPFDEVLMRVMLERIEQSLREHPRDLVVIYRRPLHSTLFESSPMFETVVGNRRYRIYRAKAEAQPAARAPRAP